MQVEAELHVRRFAIELETTRLVPMPASPSIAQVTASQARAAMSGSRLPTRVKICGITAWDDARLSVDLGAAALGFNFYPSSPRAISPADAWRIIRRLPPFVEAVGVFVNWPPLVVEALARALRLHTVQLHGGEPPEDVDELARSYRVIKAVQVGPGFRLANLSPYRRADGILLDGFARGLHGGTGRTLDWKLALAARRYGRIVLAGGLTPGNIAGAIRVAQPYAVDVCSGVEARPGRKSPARLRALFAAVEQVARQDISPPRRP